MTWALRRVVHAPRCGGALSRATLISVRDIALLLIFFAFVRISLVRPWLGVLALTVVATMQLHGYGGEAIAGFPYYLALFVPVVIGYAFSSETSQPLPRDWRLLALALLWLVFLASTMYATMPWYAWSRFAELSKIFAALLLSLLLFDTREKLFYLLITVSLSIALVTLKGGYWAVMTGFADRVYGPPNSQFYGNNHFAVLVVMNIPLLVLWWRETANRRLRVVLTVMIALSIGAALSSWSRGALLSLSVVSLLLVWHSRYKVIALPLLAVGVALVLFGLSDEWLARMQTISSYEADQSANNRLDAWRIGLEYAVIHPWLGVGFEGWSAVSIIDWHSAFIEVLAEHGVPGFVLWMGLLLGTLWDLTRLAWQARGDPQREWVVNYSLMLRASLIGYSIGALFSGLAYWDILYHLIVIAVLLRRAAMVPRAGPEPDPAASASATAVSAQR